MPTLQPDDFDNLPTNKVVGSVVTADEINTTFGAINAIEQKVGAHSAGKMAGPLIQRGPKRFDPLYYTNLTPRRYASETPVNLLPHIQSAIAAIKSDGWPAILDLGGGIWDLQGTLVIDTPKIILKGAGTSKQSLGGPTESDGAVAGGTILRAMNNFVGTEVVRFMYDTADRLYPLDALNSGDFSVDGNHSGTGNMANVHDGIHFRAYNGKLFNFDIFRCPGNGLRIRGYTAAERSAASDWWVYESQIFFFNTYFNSRHGVLFDILSTDMHLGHFTTFHNGVAAGTTSTDGPDVTNYGDGLAILNGSANQITDFQSYSNRRRGVTCAQARNRMFNVKIENNARGGCYFTGGDASQIVGGNFANNSGAAADTYDDIQIGGGGSGCSNGLVTACQFNPGQYGTGSRSRYPVNLVDGNAQGWLIDGNSLVAGGGAGEANAKDRMVKISSATYSATTASMIRGNARYNPYGTVTAPSFPATGVGVLVGSVAAHRGCDMLVSVFKNGATITSWTIDGVAQAVPPSSMTHFSFMLGARQTVIFNYTGGPPVWIWDAN